MDSLITYFQMGGYAWFVWPAYAATLTIMAVLVANSLSTLRADRKILDALEANNPRRARHGQPTDSEAAPAAQSEEANDDA